MLELFTPAMKGWNMTQMETKSEPTLLEICARKGVRKHVCTICGRHSVCVCVRVRGFFSFFFIVSMGILSEINFMMMMV